MVAISDAEVKQQSLRYGCYVIYVLAMIVVCLRLYARKFLVGSLGADDYLIIAASITSTGIIVTVPYMYNLGIGRHYYNLTEYEILYGRRWGWISQILYYFALGLAKTSMVALYVRLASDKKHIYLLYGMGTMIFLHGLAAAITTSHMCSPVSIVWSNTFPAGCINLLTFNYFNAAFHILSDLILAILPIPILKHLNMNKKRKLGLSILFSIGILTIAITIARQVTNAISLTHVDFPWYWSPAELCTCLEVNMGIVCASAPAMRSLFKGRFGGSSDKPSKLYEANSNTRGTFGSRGAIELSSVAASGDPKSKDTSRYRSGIFSNTRKSTSNESEEDIIPHHPKKSLVKTTEFQVSYTSRNREDEELENRIVTNAHLAK
ncbi:MAG: hypothetical protein M1834_006419 [Cirrosporium novae-zelandiae]|nr:MAG: hypothetical protein M1834_006419 [Cirrosporium novae-zelandiae]